MFKILAVLFIALGVILYISCNNNLKQGNINKKKMEELKKSKQSATTFIFAGISILCVDIMFSFLK